jgi:hypothetical protein
LRKKIALRNGATDAIRAVARGLLAQGFGPEAIAMAVAAFAGKPNVSAVSDFFFHAAQIVAEPLIARDPQELILEISS